MRKPTVAIPLSAIALAACGSPEPAIDNRDITNLALNGMDANELAAENGIGDEPQAEAAARVAPAPAPAPTAAAKPAPKPPAPEPPAPKPATKPPEPTPDPDPDCAPEHRAAGHC